MANSKINRIMDGILEKEESDRILYAKARKIVRKRIGFGRFIGALSGRDRTVPNLIEEVKLELERSDEQG